MSALTSLRRRPGCGVLCLSLAQPVLAGDISVNTTADDNLANSVCSLREAMQDPFNGAPHRGCSGASAAGLNTITLSACGTCTVSVPPADVIAARESDSAPDLIFRYGFH